MQADYGVALEDAPKCASGRAVTFIGIGPGKWLAMSQRAEPGFVAVLAAQLDGLASVVEQSDGLAVLQLSGPALPALLEKGFQIDCDAFGADGAAVTSVHHVGATIWATGDGGFASRGRAQPGRRPSALARRLRGRLRSRGDARSRLKPLA